MRRLELTLTLWPPRQWLIWRIDNTVMDWVLFAGPIFLRIAK